ncbi:MAG: GspE/PulE family protein [Clostridioides sp.]|nr:GspE/PulE family protein [Clostridioides sp.]
MLGRDRISNLLNDILSKAVEMKASDVHIEPFDEYAVIRMRVDGELIKIMEIDEVDYLELTTVIKLSASMDIAEKRLPQDGRTDISVEEKSIDIRVSTMPTIYGEKVVLRILERNSFLKKKRELGLTNEAMEVVDSMLEKKYGLILVTGATGSGKTTTVYSMLSELKDESKNIMTIENPVEYKMEGVNQIQVNQKIGLTFETGLRSILRQDPDIIMVGEIRDSETAKIAIRAAITGHLVISTLHTSDAASAIIRLVEMGIEPYLIRASIIGVISQKLVKKRVNKSKYAGRTAIFEIIMLGEKLKSYIDQTCDLATLRNKAMDEGMITFESCLKNLIVDNEIEISEEPRR